MAWLDVLRGIGRTFVPDVGNRGNAPASPPVQAGNYEWIIPQMYPNLAIVNVPGTPPEFEDWRVYAMNTYGISGLTGGGSTGGVPSVVNGPVEYYDTGTGMYIGNVRTS